MASLVGGSLLKLFSHNFKKSKYRNLLISLVLKRIEYHKQSKQISTNTENLRVLVGGGGGGRVCMRVCGCVCMCMWGHVCT